LLLLGLSAQACRSLGLAPVVPVAEPVSRRFAAVRAMPRESLEQREAALAAAREVAAADPGWVAPRRLVDDLMRQLLRGPEALAARRRELAEDPDDPAALYLVGRLEGREGREELERAGRLGGSAWTEHGLAWAAFSSGEPERALRPGERALALARDPYERAFFTRALVRYREALGEDAEARALLFEGLNEELAPLDRRELERRLIESFLSSREDALLRQGFRLGLERLREGEASGLPGMFALLWSVRHRVGGGEDAILGALRGRSEPVAKRIRARMLLERGADALALAARGAPYPNTREWRRARMALGDAAGAVEDWLERLPAQVLDGEGRPRDRRLAQLVEASRGEDLGALAEALFECGWFEELSGLCDHLALEEPGLALDYRARAAVGRAALAQTRRVLDRLDAGEEVGLLVPGSGPGEQDEGSSGRGLEDLLHAMQPGFEEWEALAGEAIGPLVETPRFSFGPFANILHPGPRFSAADERAGRGVEGERVAGLALALDSMGRFGVFGVAPGLGGPDGTILRRVALEPLDRRVLGVELQGTVAWCEGIDLPSRPARRGAGITGAALHEGYWIDLEGVREDVRAWRELEELWVSNPAPLEAALAQLGPRRPAGESAARLGNPLGEGRRIRLAVLADRASEGRGVGLEDLLEVTARHEEGHLLDRKRYLPITRHLLRGLALLFEGGFSAAGVARRLEYRAQLAALCLCEDPRLPLSDLVTGAESGGDTTPHAAGYRNLLGDFLGELARDESALSQLDGERFLLYQLHRLPPEVVRGVALRLARRESVP